jgi:hypothetical protein
MAYDMLRPCKSVPADGAWVTLLLLWLLWIGIVSSHLRLWEMQEGNSVVVLVGRGSEGGESVIDDVMSIVLGYLICIRH